MNYANVQEYHFTKLKSNSFSLLMTSTFLSVLTIFNFNVLKSNNKTFFYIHLLYFIEEIAESTKTKFIFYFLLVYVEKKIQAIPCSENCSFYVLLLFRQNKKNTTIPTTFTLN